MAASAPERCKLVSPAGCETPLFIGIVVSGASVELDLVRDKQGVHQETESGFAAEPPAMFRELS